MDLLGVSMKSKRQGIKRSKKKEGIKVVYISSPMKVETSASKFRAIVQELTGKDSDAARFMDGNGNEQNPNSPVGRKSLDPREFCGTNNNNLAMNYSSSSNYTDNSSSSPGSDSVFESFDRYLPPMEGSFLSMFQPNFLHEYTSHELDVFN